MTTVHTLASGSSGNALLLCSDTTRILLDTGISCRRITTALRELDLTPEALFAGTEATIDIHFLRSFNYRISGEYVYTYNCDEHIPLSFSPPFSMRNTLTWQRKQVMLYAEWQSIARQNRVDRNEDRTPGANLFHLGGSLNIPIRGNQAIEITLTARNIFNTRYYNHLSFYRKVEIPEPGRNFQILIKVPFKKLL